MRLDDCVFVTSNRGKLREAEAVLGVALRHRGLDLDEPQSLDLRYVVEAKARAAFAVIGGPVLVEDTALELLGLDGFPGPLIRWLLTSVGPAGLSTVSRAFGDPRAVARCQVCAFDGRSMVVGEGVVDGSIADGPRGAGGFGWDCVFVPAAGDGRTYGELTDDEKNAISHRRRAFVALRDALGA